MFFPYDYDYSKKRLVNLILLVKRSKLVRRSSSQERHTGCSVHPIPPVQMNPAPLEHDEASDLSSHSSENSEILDEENSHRNELIITIVQLLSEAIIAYTSGLYNRQEYHTSALSGYAWVLELLAGHPDRIRCELGVSHQVFETLIHTLRSLGCQDSQDVRLEEKLAIFLYSCVTGLTIRHVGERFQRANSTISRYVTYNITRASCLLSSWNRYFKDMLFIFSSPPFYTNFVQLPNVNDPTHPIIQNNDKWYPFFNDAIGAIDGTHIICSPSRAERSAVLNRHGLPTQNCLVACSFDLRFLYVLGGWEGSASDALVYHNARENSLPIPAGKYYLADAGFPHCEELLVPYRGIRYHLAEWGPENSR